MAENADLIISPFTTEGLSLTVTTHEAGEVSLPSGGQIGYPG